MASTGSRTLQLLSLLQNRRYWSGAQLADRMEVSARTLRRDVDRLRDMGYPVEARRGVDGGYQLAAGAALPPLVLEDEEAIALAVGLQSAVQAGSVVGIEESSVRALSKIVQVMPQRLRRQVDALAAMTVPAVVGADGPHVDPTALASIAQACRDCERLWFAYRSRQGDPTERHVDPHRLVLLGRRWYLVAWDLERFDWRTFRVDRLADARGTGSHFPARTVPGGDAARFVREAIDSQPFRHAIEVVIHADAATVEGQMGRWAVIDDLGPGRCLARMTADSLDWPMMALSATEAEFEVVAPPDLIAHIRERMGRFERAIGNGRS
jgi:predicted DNA-binding transcriptional regulator YafY